MVATRYSKYNIDTTVREVQALGWIQPDILSTTVVHQSGTSMHQTACSQILQALGWIQPDILITTKIKLPEMSRY